MEQINIALNVCTIIFFVFMVGIYLSKKNISNLETKLYKRLLIFNGIYLFVHLFWLLLGDRYLYHDYLLSIASNFHFVVIIIWLYYFTFYTFLLSYESNESFKNYYFKNKKSINIFLGLFVIIICIIQMILPTTVLNNDGEILFDVVGINQYYFFGVALIFLLINIFTLFKNRKICDKSKMLPYKIIGLFCIITLLISIFYPSLCSVLILITIISYLLYHTLENPDTKMITDLNTQKNKLEKAFASKYHFLNTVSNQLDAPLNTILELSKSIELSSTNEREKNDARSIMINAENSLELVDNIIDINKIESKDMEIVENNYNPLIIINDIVNLLKVKLLNKNVEFNVNYESAIPYQLYGDKAKIKRIITNLLNNAFKFTNTGSIDFTLSCNTKKDTCFLKFSVKDTGRGISEEEQKFIFEDFMTSDRVLDQNDYNACLCLFVTKSLIEELGGHLEVESTYGSGSNFTVYLTQKISIMNADNSIEALLEADKDYNYNYNNQVMNNTIPRGDVSILQNSTNTNINSNTTPVANVGINTESPVESLVNNNTPSTNVSNTTVPDKSEIEVISYTPSLDNSTNETVPKTDNNVVTSQNDNNNVASTINTTNDSANKKVFLIVDDNKLNLKVAAKMLQKYNCNIELANSGSEAIDFINSGKHCDLIFMDIMMPNMNGVETMHKLKSLNNFNIPVIALTADAMEGSREKYLGEGFDEYFSKPIVRETLEEVLAKFNMLN